MRSDDQRDGVTKQATRPGRTEGVSIFTTEANRRNEMLAQDVRDACRVVKPRLQQAEEQVRARFLQRGDLLGDFSGDLAIDEMSSCCCVNLDLMKSHCGQSKTIARRLTIWLLMATKRSKNSRPPASISICMVPERLKVWRLRMMRAR